MPPSRALFCLCLALAACAPAVSRPAAPAATPERLAACLARKGAHLYGASWCHWCHVQLEMFGRDASKVPYTDCEPDMTLILIPECVKAGITDDTPLPTWIFRDGTRAIGRQSLAWLAAKTGCPAP